MDMREHATALYSNHGHPQPECDLRYGRKNNAHRGYREKVTQKFYPKVITFIKFSYFSH